MPESRENRRSKAGISYSEFVAIIAFLMALNAAAIDIALPALGPISNAFGIADDNSRQLIITAYVVAFGASQLIYGPLADRFGRRPILFVGLAIYTASSLAATFAIGFTSLLVLRTIQGIGAGATRTMAIAVVRDCYSGREMASIMSLAMMVFMAVPIVAPTLGQGLLMIAGWRWILLLISLCGLLMIAWTRRRLPETLAEENRRPLSGKKVIEAFMIVITNRTAGGYGIALALVFGCLFAFLNSAQQIYQEVFKLGALFPVAFSAGALVIAWVAYINARLVRTIGMRRLSHIALGMFALTNSLLYGLVWYGEPAVSFATFFVLSTISFGFFGFIGSNFNAIAMEPLGHVAGTGSAVLGFMQTFIGGLVGAAIGLAYDGTIQPMMLGFVILSFVTIGTVAWCDAGNLFGPGEQRRSAAE